MIGSALLLAGLASAQDYRRITLQDGRTLVGDLLQMEAGGLRVAVPQGKLVVRYDAVVDMVAADAEAFAAQPPWVVWLAAPAAARPGLANALAGIPRVAVWPDAPAGTLTADEVAAAEACGQRLECLATALSGGGGERWVVVASPHPDDDTWALTGAVPTGGTRTTSTAAARSDLELWAAANEVLGLLPPGRMPAEILAVPLPGPDLAPPPLARGQRASPLVPLPGITALAAKDQRGWTALAVGVPAMAAWVAVSGAVATSPGEHVGLAAGGAWLTAIALNVAVAPRAAPATRTAGTPW